MPASIIPPMITAIWYRWVRLTAFDPPDTTYSITINPITIVVTDTGQPKIVDSTIAGAYSVIPADNPLSTRNRIAPRVRVFRSKRVSRYSYAVNTFSL